MKGGKRPGAGRKRGVPNRALAAREAAIAASGLTPLEYMLTTMRDEGKPLLLTPRYGKGRGLSCIHALRRWNRLSKWIDRKRRRSPSLSWKRTVP